MTPVVEAARGAFHRLAERGWGQWGWGTEGLGGTNLFLQDPSCQDLPTWYEMLGNVTLQTDVPQLHTENWRSGYTHCIQKDRNEGKMKRGGEIVSSRGVTKTRVPNIYSNLEVAYETEIIFSFHPMAW